MSNGKHAVRGYRLQQTKQPQSLCLYCMQAPFPQTGPVQHQNIFKMMSKCCLYTECKPSTNVEHKRCPQRETELDKSMVPTDGGHFWDTRIQQSDFWALHTSHLLPSSARTMTVGEQPTRDRPTSPLTWEQEWVREGTRRRQRATTQRTGTGRQQGRALGTFGSSLQNAARGEVCPLGEKGTWEKADVAWGKASMEVQSRH